MAAKTLTLLRMSPGAVGGIMWRVTWGASGGTPTYYVCLDGQLAQTTTQLYIEITIGTGEQVQIDVFDDVVDVPDPCYPSRVWLSWDAVDDVAQYEIEQYVNAAWTQVGSVRATGDSNYSWQSAVLADDAQAQFRIKSLGTNGCYGVVRAVSLWVVRYPDAPDVTYAYDAETGTVTVAAAA